MIMNQSCMPDTHICIIGVAMKKAETLGLISMLSALFDSTQFVDNARQGSAYAVGIFSGFNASDQLRMETLNILNMCMNYEPSTIFFNRIQIEYTVCRETLVKAEAVRKAMIVKRAETSTVFLACLFCLKEYLQHKNKRIMYDTALPLLMEAYGEHFGSYLLQQFMHSVTNMDKSKKAILLFVMDTVWMQDNV